MFVLRTSRAFQLTLSNCKVTWSIFPLRAISRFNQPDPEMSKTVSSICQKRQDRGWNKAVLRNSYKDKLLSQGLVPRTQELHVYVAGSGAYDESRSVIVCSRHQGTAVIDDIFVTYNSWENVGGLYGALMGIVRTGSEQTRLHGPPDVEQLLRMTKNFGESPVAITNIEKREIGLGSYSDWLMDIEYVKIPREKPGDRCESSKDSTTEVLGMRKLEEDKKATDFAVAYILRVKENTFRGKTDAEKINAIDRKNRAWVSDLYKNGTTTLPDGRVIKKEEVFQKVKPHHPVVILECPNIDFLPSFTSSEQLLKLSCEEKDEPCLMVHMSPVHIVEMPEYQEFMNRFKNSNHLMLNGKSKAPIRRKSTAFHQFLNHLHPGLFPVLPTYSSHAKASVPQEGRIIQGETGLEYNWLNEKGFDWSSCQFVNKETSIHEECSSHTQSEEIIKSWRRTLRSLPKPKDERPYPEVVFLGTGSASPSPLRNVTGILLHLSPEKCMLLDCGDGTSQQIRSFYGDKADDVFKKLTAVFISHLHADHHMGLFGILNARRKAFQNLGLPVTRLTLLAPIQFQRWLFLYCKLIKDVFDEVELIRHLPMKPSAAEHVAQHNSLLEKLELAEISVFEISGVDYIFVCTVNMHNIVSGMLRQVEEKGLEVVYSTKTENKYETVVVNHVPYAYGLSMKHKDGWKFVYSGDTIPCQTLVDAGKDCDLLIHEGTFCDMLEYEALAKNHSTTSQAIQIARQMNAKFTILTHFSQRYHKIPVFTNKFTDDIGFSFDFMRVTRDNAHIIPHLRQVLEPLYSNYIYTQSVKRRRQKESLMRNVKMYDETIPKKSGIDEARNYKRIKKF